jgi:Protein of unknown function (DUF1566)
MRRSLVVAVSTAVLFLGGILAGRADAAGIQDVLDALKGVTQNWDKKLPANDPGGSCPSNSSRFTCVLGGAAARDNETGLVWETTPQTATKPWADAADACEIRVAGGRMGWRLPSIVELTSLVDVPEGGDPVLPAGHPFNVPPGRGNTETRFWSATTVAGSPNTARAISFVSPFELGAGIKTLAFHVWCVRGGMHEHEY